MSPLGLAAGEGDLELVKLLLEAGAPLNDPTQCVRYGGPATPLCNAVWADKPEVVEFLLKQGAATNVVGGRFVRSLTEYANKYSSKRIRELLAQYGDNPPLGQAEPEKVTNQLPGRIASGEFKLPKGLK